MTIPEGSKLDHIAIAVNSIEKSKQLYIDLGLSFSKDYEIVESQKVKTLFASLSDSKSGDESHLELLEPLGSEGPIYNFLQKNGEGIHHIAFKVDNVVKSGDNLRVKGYRLLFDKPVAGANGKLVNFIHPKSAGGVLIEITEDQEMECV